MSDDFKETRNKCSKTAISASIAIFLGPVLDHFLDTFLELFFKTVKSFGASRHPLAGCCLVL